MLNVSRRALFHNATHFTNRYFLCEWSLGNLLCRNACTSVSSRRRYTSDINYILKVFTTHEVSITPKKCNNISLFESNHLPANSPTEDRRFYGTLNTIVGDEDGVTCIGVVDGHAGYKCAQAVNERLLSYLAIAMASDPESAIDSLHMVSRVKLPGDYKESTVHQDRHFDNLLKWARCKEPIDAFSMRHLDDTTFKTAFETLDKHLIENAISALSSNLSDYDIDVIETGLSGCCVLTVAIDNDDIICANTGDSKAVLGQLSDDGVSYTAVPLTKEHNYANESERLRVLNEHPESEHRFVLQNGRLLGSLLPLRSFGDMLFKINRDQLKQMKTVFNVKNFEDRSLTPPYLKVTPEVTRKSFERGKDKFVILATDGLWDFIDSQTAVDVIGHHLNSSSQGNLNPQSLSSEDLDKYNAAVNRLCTNGSTRLICHAIGQSNCSTKLPLFAQLEDMIRLAPEEVRQNRDDIQVSVLYFD